MCFFFIMKAGIAMAPHYALRPCREPGCHVTQEPGTNTCLAHKRPQGPKRGEVAALQMKYCTRARTEGRVAFPNNHPLCCECQKKGVLSAATIVDHIEPHRGDPALFYDQGNWQPKCKPCHDAKTAAEDGGFGNQRRSRGRRVKYLVP